MFCLFIYSEHELLLLQVGFHDVIAEPDGVDEVWVISYKTYT